MNTSDTLIRLTYPASLNAQFCPLIAPTRCCQATLPKCRGSSQSISCRHCWSHRWSRACSPPCCGETCCWSVYSWQTCIWTNLMKEKDKDVLLLCDTETNNSEVSWSSWIDWHKRHNVISTGDEGEMSASFLKINVRRSFIFKSECFLTISDNVRKDRLLKKC